MLQREEVCVVWTAAHETLAVLLKDTADISLPAFISGLIGRDIILDCVIGLETLINVF